MKCQGCGETLEQGDAGVMVADAIVTEPMVAEKSAMGNYVVYCTGSCLQEHSANVADI